MTLALLVFLAVWLLTPPGSEFLWSRLGALPRSSGGQRSGSRNQSHHGLLLASPLRRAVLCASAFALVGWIAAGPAAVAVGILLGVSTSWWIGRLEPPCAVRAREEVARDLPIAVDLLAACAFVGRPVDESLLVVARAVGGALAERLGQISARLALGADPAVEWGRLAADPQLAPLARTLSRTLESGAPLVDGLSRLAEDCRRERRTQSQLRARNVGVKAAGPLAACFLPAFMLIGVVPTLAGAFAHLIM